MTQPLQPATAPKAQAKQRDPWLDNAKMVLVTIVVVGHMMVLVPNGDEQSRTYDFIYYFHIPAFVLLTGYLSRTFRYSKRHLWALFTTLVVPYVVFSWLMIHWREIAGPGATGPRVVPEPALADVVPRGHRDLAPADPAPAGAPRDGADLRRGQPARPALTNQELFDINRALGFLPFFVIGLHLSPSTWPSCVAASRGWRESSGCWPCGGWRHAPTATGRPSSSTSGRRTRSSALPTSRASGSGRD